MQRVDDIARTCESIIGGQLSERIALRGRGDEWDRLAGAINDMLNRIALLLENLQQVSSDVAHDLRSPLTRLRNRLEAARSGSTTASEYAAAVSRALEDTDQLLAIFSALLRISQVEAGTRAGAFSDVSLSDVVQRLYEMYRPVAEDYQHELECDIRAGVHVRGDSELLIQMFSNLIENAIRHTPSRSRIRISLEPVEDRAVVVGLALVAAIAELHHAVLLFADAEPGLAVSVKFPLAREAALDAQRSPAAGAVPVSEGCSTSIRTEPGRMP
jgi:signal transduction histidine kinase